MTIQNSESKRPDYLDILRIIGILMVLFQHGDTYTYFVNLYGINTAAYIATLILSIISKAGPPIFFMISGTLLLGREESFIKICRHRMMRIVVLMIIGAAWMSRNDHRFVEKLLSENNWFLYSYLAFLIMLPFFRIIAQHAKKNDMKLFFWITAIMYSIQILWIGGGEFVSCSLLMYLPLFTASWASLCWNIIFPLLGYFVANFEALGFSKEEERRYEWILAVGTVISVIGSAVMISMDICYRDRANLEMIRQFFILFPSCFIFFECKKICKKHRIRTIAFRCILMKLASASFGVFLLDSYTSIRMRVMNNTDWMIPTLGEYVTLLISIGIELLSASAIILVFIKIPIIKKLL